MATFEGGSMNQGRRVLPEPKKPTTSRRADGLVLSEDERRLAKDLERLASEIISGGENLGDGNVAIIGRYIDTRPQAYNDSDSEMIFQARRERFEVTHKIPTVITIGPVPAGNHSEAYFHLARASDVVEFLKKPEVKALMLKCKVQDSNSRTRNPDRCSAENSSNPLKAEARAIIVRAMGIACRVAQVDLIDLTSSPTAQTRR